MVETEAERVFPFDSFRHKQQEITETIIKALYFDDYDNVVLDAPTGTGKSGILTAILRYAEDGFYTTPQKSLREQLQNDNVLQDHLRSLKARRDYTCGVTGENCEDCSINQSSDKSCSEFAECTYWSAKMAAMQHEIPILTFSYFIIDSMLPEEVNGTPVSFGHRQLNCVDEAHGLTQQTSDMHAGVNITPYRLPKAVFGTVTDSCSLSANMYEDVQDEVRTIRDRCKSYVGDTPPNEREPAQKRCQRLADRIDWIEESNTEWVVDVERDEYKGEYKKTLEIRPINVGNFLQNRVWNRADKTIISTATLPYRGNPDIWLHQVGLDPDNTLVISVPMPFPVQNRPIHTHKMVASMSNRGDDENWDEIMETLNEISKEHYNQKGLIHTASYGRAERIVDSIDPDEHPYLHENCIAHNNDRDSEVVIEDWQTSDHDIMLSPSMMEGVDLPGEMATWQALLKVPYPSRDSRTEYILNNKDWGWNWYFEKALIRVVQSYGRAIRSETDKADYYVLDEDFEDLMKKRTPPEWFTEAIDLKGPDSRSIFDY